MQGTKEINVVWPIIGKRREGPASRDEACCHVLAARVMEGFLSMPSPRVECILKERVARKCFAELLPGINHGVLESAFGEVGCANCGEEGMRVRIYFSEKAIERLLNRVIYRYKVRRKTITLLLDSTHE